MSDPSDPSTVDLADARFRALSARTVDEYDRVARAVLDFITARLGRPPTLADLTPALVRAWMTERPRTLAPASRSACLRALHAFAGWAMRESRFADHPLRTLRPEPGPDQRPEWNRDCEDLTQGAPLLRIGHSPSPPRSGAPSVRAPHDRPPRRG